MEEKPRRSACDYLVSIMYMRAGTLDIIANHVHNVARHSSTVWDLRREKKMAFSAFQKSLQIAATQYEEFSGDLWLAARKARPFQDLQEENNAMVRMDMRIADGFSHSPRLMAKLEKFLIEEGEPQGIFCEHDYDCFRLK